MKAHIAPGPPFASAAIIDIHGIAALWGRLPKCAAQGRHACLDCHNLVA
jgi:hypothetical protein